jgi:DNA-binding transcriptional ArsR family regulator
MTASAGESRYSRGIQEAVSYAVGHRIRVEILAALNEREDASASELARIARQPLSTVTHHVEELLKSGSIEVARTEKVRSVQQNFYRTVIPTFASDEEMEAMSEDERLELCRVILQALMAETLASFWSGKLTSDPKVFLCWAWFNVDVEGRSAIAEEQVRSWRRIGEIEREAAARCEDSGEEPFSVLVSGVSFDRARTAARLPGSRVDL